MFFATFETRDIATRPATRCKAYYYSLVWFAPRASYVHPHLQAIAMTLIRPSLEADIPAIQAIYAHHVLYGTGTFETEPPDEAEIASRRKIMAALRSATPR